MVAVVYITGGCSKLAESKMVVGVVVRSLVVPKGIQVTPGPRCQVSKWFVEVYKDLGVPVKWQTFTQAYLGSCVLAYIACGRGRVAVLLPRPG